MKFPVIMADPPWAYKVWERGCTYPTQSIEWIQSLRVADVAAEDCVLLLWATYPTLPEALKVIVSWGFTYRTVAYTWIKTCKDGTPSMGLGNWTRANAEICILAVKGKPKRISKGVRQVIMAPNLRHSQKPFEQYDRTESLLEGPYLELFARPNNLFNSRLGWTQIGNEITGRDITEDLKILAETQKSGRDITEDLQILAETQK